MTTVGDNWLPVFPDLTSSEGVYIIETDTDVTVGSPGVRDAIAKTPGLSQYTFSDSALVVRVTPTISFGTTVQTYLVDEQFTDPTMAGWTVTNGTPTVANGQLTLPANSALTNNNKPTPDGHSLAIYGTADAGVPTGVRIRSTVSSSRYVQITRAGTNLNTYVSPAPTTATDAADNVVLRSYTLDPVAHICRRIRIAGGTVYIEVSSNGASWIALRTVPAPGWVATETAEFAILGSSGSGASATVDRAVIA